MNNMTEKVAYLKGLMNGLELDTTTKEGKLLAAVVEVLDEMALSIVDVEEAYDELQEVVDAIDEDLGELEEDFYDEDECECDCCEDEEYEIVCPSCGDAIYVDYDMLQEGEMECPNCGEHLEFDLEAMEDECGCSCEDGHCDCGCED